MSKKHSLSALGAALLAGLTLATAIAPAANAAPAATSAAAKASVQNYQQIQLIKSPAANKYEVVRSKNAGQYFEVGETYALPSLATANASKIDVIPRDGDSFNLNFPGGSNSTCIATWDDNHVGSRDSYLTRANCDTVRALWTMPTEGVFKSLAGHYIASGNYSNAGGSSPLWGTTTDPSKAYAFEGITIGAGLQAAGVFAADNHDAATISGTGAANARITAKDAAGKIVFSTTADTDGAFSMGVNAPDKGGVYSIHVSQTVDGKESAPVKVDLDYGKGVAISTPADQADHASSPVAMSGTGTPGGSITVFDNAGTTSIGDARVDTAGNWTLTTSALNGAEHRLTVKQLSKGNNTTSATVTINPGKGEGDLIAAPTVTSPASGSTVNTSRPTITGTGQAGATVTVGYGANTIIGRATVNAQGTFSMPLTSGLSLGVSNLKVVQTSGSDVKTIGYSLNRVAATAPFTVTSHSNNATYSDGVAIFRGTGTEGATIVAKNQWGTVMGNATVKDGQWSFNRNLGPTDAGYDITFTQSVNGASSEVRIHLNYAGVLGLDITSPVNDSTYVEGATTFTGRAMPGTTIVATNQWNTVMGRATANLAGDWTFTRNLGPTTNGYDIRFVATKGTDTQTKQIHLKNAISNVPVQVGSIRDGATYRPGMNILSGTGTPGATINAVNATNNWNVPMGSATVGTDGKWALPERNWGPSNDYQIKVTQTNPDKTTSTTTINIKAPVFEALNVISYTLGAANGAGVYATFTGTSTAYATVTIRSGASSSVYQTVEADENGDWTARRTWDPAHTYKLIFDQLAIDGQADSVNYGTFTAK